MIEQLQKQIKVVAEARNEAAKLNEVKRLAYVTFEQYNKPLLDSATDANKLALGAEAVLRELTLKAYAETGDKAPAVGVGIREVTKYSYNSEEALKWAIEHKMALKLDETKFKNHVKADPPDFVKITTEPKATIATNLEEKDEG